MNTTGNKASTLSGTLTKQKYTPGPWAASGQKTRYVMVGAHTVIAVLPHSRGMESHYVIENDSERRANARLIATAPRLLTVLIQAVESAGFSLSGPTDWRAAEHGEPAWVCNARAVIAEATQGKE